MNNIAFVVGCEEYDNVDNLEGVNNDVASMQSALIDHCGCLHENVYIISNQPNSACEPTVTKILNLIVQKSQSYSSESIENLFFYFSGHGYLSAQNKVCLVLKDSMISPITVGTVEVETIISALKQFDNVKHIILFLDICQNEIMTKGVIGDQIIFSDYFPQGVVIFFSCFPQNASYMIPLDSQKKYGRGSVFTKCLVKSFAPENNCHNVREISEYLKKEVIDMSKKLGLDQKPYTLIQDNSLNDVILANHSTDAFLSLSKLDETSRVKVENCVNMLVNNEDISICLNFGISNEKKLSKIYNSFLYFIRETSNDDLLSFLSSISLYIKDLTTCEEFIGTELMKQNRDTNYDIPSMGFYLLDFARKPISISITYFVCILKSNLSVIMNYKPKYTKQLSVMKQNYLSIVIALTKPLYLGTGILNDKKEIYQKIIWNHDEFLSIMFKYITFLTELIAQSENIMTRITHISTEISRSLSKEQNIDKILSPIIEVRNDLGLMKESINGLIQITNNIKND